MKKAICILVCAVCIIALFIGKSVLATEDVTVEIDGNVIEFDVKPKIIDGRTMVPLRKIFEEIGALVKWDEDTQTVSARKSSKTVTLAVQSSELLIDKGKTDDEGNPIVETVMLDVPAQIIQDRTLVPLRAVAESFGLGVEWDEDNQKVTITSDDGEDESWKENVGSINLTERTFEGEGIAINENQIIITSGGDFTLTGTLTDGNIVISAQEKVKLRLSGVTVTSCENPCIFAESAEKVYITLTDKTQNTLIAENSQDGAIYSKENLEIKGNGTLTIQSLAGHGIKASDNLTMENGTVCILAESDGIHINDTFKMTGGVLDITAAGDGIDSESIVIISGGSVRIETTGVPVETSAITNTAPSTARKGMWEETADVEFEKSSKGINAEWMLYISGGEITVTAASHCIHCEDEIQIDGGIFTLSSTYEKGISAHGNLTVNGSETVMDITKSTEGMESKNVLTVNDGVITVVASDDALNATGEKSGDTMGMGGNIGIGQDKGNRVPPESAQGTLTDNPAQAPAPTQSQAPARSGKGENRQPGNMQQPSEAPEAGGFSPSAGARPQTGGNAAISGNASGNMQSNGMKDCLIINGGVLELYAGDDCLDANGNLLINGGTIKATNSKGSFSGATGVIDPDGQATISKEATLIFASGSGNERSFNLTQNTITVYCAKTHTANETITLTDSNGNTLYEYTPVGSFAAVFIASDALETGETYNITVGDEVFEAAITGQSTVIGTSSTGSGGFGRGQMMR